MRIIVNLNTDDYIAFNIAHQFKSKSGKDALKAAKILNVICWIVIIIFILTLRAGLILTVVEIVAVTVFYAYLILSYDKRAKKRIRKKVQKLEKEGKLPYEKEATIDLNDDCIMEYTPSSSKKIEWNSIEHIWTDEEHVYLAFSLFQAFIIPYRCMGDQKDHAMNLILEKTGKQISD